MNRQTAKRLAPRLAVTLVMLLLVLLVAVRTLASAQSTRAMVLPMDFAGEYSTDGVTWYPLLNSDAAPDTHDDMLYLRGHFYGGVPQDVQMNFYLNHLFFSMSLNGEELVHYLPDSEYFPTGDLCGSQWYSIVSPGISEQDKVEFTLVDSHRIGSRIAYRDFLDHMYAGMTDTIKNAVGSRYQGWRIVGIATTAIGIGLLGMALAAALNQLPLARWVGNLGLLAVCTGLWLAFDTPDVQLWSNRITLNTSLILAARMGASVAVGLCVSQAVQHARPLRQHLARAAAGVLAAGVGLLALLGLTGTLTVCGMEPWWSLLWLVSGLVMTVCLAGTLVRRPTVDAAALLVLLLARLADLMNAIFLWWPDNTAGKMAVVLVLLVEAACGIRGILNNYRAAQRTREMERELQNSRLTIMLSQIQPHFLYNALTVIQALCGIDPEAAENAICEFSDYLRGNMDSLTRDKPIPFSQELDHTRHYLALEQLRFGDQLRIEYDLGPTLFRLPTLTLQPLVENAIRHGARGRQDVGTVWIATRETPSCYEVTVRDDGPGFDPAAVPRDGTHVGIANVAERMRTMCGGELRIDSAPGAGTLATLRIPKEMQLADGGEL